jgi:transcription initiation factor TFIIIB Brf1 subunit/transcription initiation factor TFIIB
MRNFETKSTGFLEAVATHALEILDRLESSEDVVTRTRDLIHLAHEDGVLASCSTVGGAAGIIYIAGILEENPFTLSVIGKAAKLQATTVRKYKTILATELKRKWR